MESTYFEILGCQRHLAQIDVWKLAPGVRPGEEDMPSAWVARVIVPEGHRNEGVGTRLMRRLIEDADSEGVALVLSAEPYGDLDLEAITAWYRKLGFEGPPERMVRKPLRRMEA